MRKNRFNEQTNKFLDLNSSSADGKISVLGQRVLDLMKDQVREEEFNKANRLNTFNSKRNSNDFD